MFERKISETLLVFGEPLLKELPEPPPAELLRSTLSVVVTVWNALVLAGPAWKEPGYLEQLRTLSESGYLPGPFSSALETLTRRRVELFSDDVRTVADWDVEPGESGGFMFRCDARIPSSHVA